MKAYTYALSEILQQQARYIIPTFQRDYEWTRDGQWELLFDDLESVADQLFRHRLNAELAGNRSSHADKQVPPHFLGALVFDRLDFGAGQLAIHAVIDGQQRLTTLQLLLRGLLDVLEEVESTRAPQVRDLILNPEYAAREPEEVYKLWPRRRDREEWIGVMADEADGSKHRYAEARRYFASRFSEAIKGPDGEDRTDVVVDGFLSLFKLVVIDLDDNDDAQLIFEVLNGRQTPLSAADLVKNLLFLRAELMDERELDALYEQYWAPLDDDWWKRTVGRGHAARGRRDILLSAWLTAASATEINVGHLYGEVRKYLDSTARKTDDVLQELSVYANAYVRLYGRALPASERIGMAYSRLDSLGIATAIPLLLWLQTIPEARLSQSDHELAVLAVESWIIRRLITGANTRGYGQRFVEVLQAAQTAERIPDADIARSIVDALDSGTESMAWPSDDDLVSACVDRKVYGSFSQPRVRMLLGAIDRQLRTENKRTEPATFDYDKLQIEHVMPQHWSTHWPISESDPAAAQLSAQKRNSAVHRIGNLTLVTGAFNAELSNGAWSEKRPALIKESSLQLNGYFMHVSRWDEDAIDQRAIVLSEVLARVWPGADALRAAPSSPEESKAHVPPPAETPIPGRLSAELVESANRSVASDSSWGSFALVRHDGNSGVTSATWFSEFEAADDGLRVLRHSALGREQTWTQYPYEEIAGATHSAGELLDLIKDQPAGTHHQVIVEAKPHIAHATENGSMGPGVLHSSAPDTTRRYSTGSLEAASGVSEEE